MSKSTMPFYQFCQWIRFLVKVFAGPKPKQKITVKLLNKEMPTWTFNLRLN